jgi:hypothetical protein
VCIYASSSVTSINSSKGCPSITEPFLLAGFFRTVRHRRGIASGATPLVASKNNLKNFLSLAQNKREFKIVADTCTPKIRFLVT